MSRRLIARQISGVLLFALLLLAAAGLAIPAARAQTGTVTPTPPAVDSTPTPPPQVAPVATPLPQADEGSPVPLVHVVEEGETLSSIAALYGTTVEVLQLLNGIDDPSVLYVGQELVIPGGEGNLVATIYTVQIGDTLRGLAEGFNTTISDISASNRLINPYNLVAGQLLTVISRSGSADPNPPTGRLHLVESGDSLLTISAQYGLAPSTVVVANDLPYPPYLYLGQRLRLPGETPYQYLAGPWQTARLYPVPLVQGESAAVYVESVRLGTPEGQFAGQALHFVPYEQGYLALLGLDAFTEPGRYTLSLSGAGERPWPLLEQEVAVLSSNYGTQTVTVAEELAYLLDPQVRAEDEALMAPFYDHLGEMKHWDGLFQQPVSNTVITAGYGDARSYNEGPISIFHTGVDFAGPVGTPIRAPAGGTVVFSDTLRLFGNTLLIDHGLGVMTGYYHLSRIHVDAGEQVVAGQIVAEGGSTGLSSGPHLHWDLRVGNVPVDGLQWTRDDIVGEVMRLARGAAP